MHYELRPISRDELPEFVRISQSAFGMAMRPDEPMDAWRALELDRTLAAFDDHELVATARLYSLELTLPASVPMPAAGVSWIGVLSTHRRRGILRALVDRQLEDAAVHSEPVAILTASESGIYRRFGFGIATSTTAIALDRREVAFTGPPPPGRVRFLDRVAAAEVFPGIFERVRQTQPGAVSRPAAWWGRAYFEWGAERSGRARFDAVYEAPDGSNDGFVSYHVEDRFVEGVACSELEVQDFVAVTRDAYASLWRHVLDFDLVRTVSAWNVAIDAPLRWLLTEPRVVRIRHLGDGLWLRVLDAAAALAARRYAVDGQLVLEVSDSFRPTGASAGRFELAGGPDGATCRTTTREADLAMDVADLGAIYLGGVRASTLARAGLIEERTPGALARADAMFASEPAPFHMTWF